MNRTPEPGANWFPGPSARVAIAIVAVTAAAMLGRRLPADIPANAPIADREVHAVPERDQVSMPRVADPELSGRIRLRIIDAATGRPVACRIHLLGADGNSYEPAENPLAPWSLQRLGNRKDKGPFRYYGWFFYSRGEAEVNVPPGATRIDVWKGLEFAPVTERVTVARNEVRTLELTIRRAVPMAEQGWHSGDTHIHFDRLKPEDDERALDLAEAEDLQFAHILCMNDPRTYRPSMDAQIHPQLQGMGKASERYRGRYGIASGQEYRCGTYGHICLIGGRRLVDADGVATDPNQWPLFASVADETHSLGGYAFHAHGGYEQEIYADFAQKATDGVELLQFAVYRGIGLEGWYHILNAGYRFPALGASDYPYCRALGDCRTYVFLTPDRFSEAKRPTFDDWNKAAAEGRSFMTTGPLVDFTVEKSRPGDTIALGSERKALTATMRVWSPVADVAELELIQDGRVVARKAIEPGNARGPIVWTVPLTIEASGWIAARARAPSGSGREDVEAHTNPIYLSMEGRTPVNRQSLRWLIDRLDLRLAEQKARSFPRKEQVVAYFQKSRDLLEARLKSD